ncbi:helix-turn-helix transcriptional regulator [Kitasatospora sp. NPDC004723]|uniref:helix-turn-helix domain-containing protein n=1 Tax=Kitasatospora sp. NPDC004723 TaxID=3154288 RepID=UPI0033A7A568
MDRAQTQSEDEPYRVVFGKRLRALREAAGLSQSAAARAMGLDRSYYARLEAGRHSIAVDRLPGVARVLGVEVGDLFAGSGS